MLRAGSGDRIILFTLVDLLLQIIFFGFFIFAANRAAEGEMQDKIGALARKFGVVSVTRYVNATSRLVAISDSAESISSRTPTIPRSFFGTRRKCWKV